MNNSSFYHLIPNPDPDIPWKVWQKLPEYGQRVEVEYYNGETNNNIWFRNNKFVNYAGFEMFNIIGWREYEKEFDIVAPISHRVDGCK